MSQAAHGFMTAIGYGAALLGSIGVILSGVVLYRSRRWPTPKRDSVLDARD